LQLTTPQKNIYPLGLRKKGLEADAMYYVDFSEGCGVEDRPFQSDGSNQYLFVNFDKPRNGIVTLTLYGYDINAQEPVGEALDTAYVTVRNSAKDILKPFINFFIIIFMIFALPSAGLILVLIVLKSSKN
jgi:hypothetical protein